MRKRKNLSRVIAILLTLFLVTSSLSLQASAAEAGAELTPHLYETHEITITEEQLEALDAIREFNSDVGLIGFEGEYTLPGDDSQVSVFVFFDNNPAPTQVIEAAIEGFHLPLEEALEIVEDDHATFQRELANLFNDGSPLARFSNAESEYHISMEYRHSFNGVAMTLPANKVSEVAQFDVVRAIMPDFSINPLEGVYEEEEFCEELIELIGQMAENRAQSNNPDPWGMSQGRARMNANQLHEEGIRGEGIIVAVIDGGVDWMHPAFAGAFPPASVINQARMDRFGPNGTAGHHPDLALPLWDGTVAPHNPEGHNELFNINRYTSGPNVGLPRAGAPEYVFLGRDTMRLWPGGGGDDLRGNPIQQGWTFANGQWGFTYPQTLPVGWPGNNPFECSPLYYFRVNEEGQTINMRTYLGLVGSLQNTVPGWSSHGTHVAGTILGRPYPALDSPDFDPGRAIMGVAPGATLVHYRSLTGGWIYASVWIGAQEWAFKDGANVVNMSYGWQEASVMSLHHHGINQMMLADPTIVFVASAGNSGTAFYTGGNPGGGTMGITVSALAEPAPAITITSNDFTGTATLPFVHVRNAARINVTDAPQRVLPMPLTAGSPAGHASLEGLPVGAGTEADFNELTSRFTPEVLRGAYVIVRRGEAFDSISARANALGMAGVISINGNGQAIAFTTASGANDTNPTPVMFILYEQGAQWARALAGGTIPRRSVFNITGRGFNPLSPSGDQPIVQGFSSRGPRETSHEISPDIGSQGVNVFSAVSRWQAAAGGMNPTAANGQTAWYDRPWCWGYGNMSGTSMSGPHLAGAVALIQHYSVENAGGMWANYEVKTRIMNTAICLDYAGSNYSPFDAARNVDVVAATRTDTVVFVEYEGRVPTVLYTAFDSPNQVFADTRSGALSFGGFNRSVNDDNPRNIGEGAASYTMTATVYNNSDRIITYRISHRFVTGRAARPAGSPTASLDGGNLVYRPQIAVPPGGRVPITFTLQIPAGEALGFYEGFVTITGGNEEIVLPFGAVVHERQPAFTFEGLYRPVVTTNKVGEGAHHLTSNELVMYFNQSWGFYADFYLIDREGIHQHPEFRGDNWFTGGVHIDGFPDLKFADYILGSTMGTGYHYAGRFGRHFPQTRGLVDETMRGVLFDGYFQPGIHEDPIEGRGEPQWLGDWLEDLGEEHSGQFYIGITVFRKSPTRAGQWAFEQSLLVPFYVDNELPQFETLEVNGREVNTEANNLRVQVFDDEVVLSGNVTDEWLLKAIDEEITFDVWTNARGELSLPENLALWALVGENTATNRPIPVDIDEDGEFTLTWPTSIEEGETPLSLWLIDGVAPVPAVNQVPVGVGNPNHTGVPNTFVVNFWNQPAVARTLATQAHFEANALIEVPTTLAPYLRSDVLFGRANSNNPVVYNLTSEQLNRFGWAGLNVNEINATLVYGMHDVYVVAEVKEWGQSVTAVIVDMGEVVTQAEVDDMDLEVSAFKTTRRVVNANNPLVVFDDDKVVTGIYVSNVRERLAPGDRPTSGNYIVVELQYGFNNTRAQVNGSATFCYNWTAPARAPYSGPNPYGGQAYRLDMEYTVTIDGIEHIVTIDCGTNNPPMMIQPIVDDFELVANPVDGFENQSYRMWTPPAHRGVANPETPKPLVLFHHGLGETFVVLPGGVSNEGVQLIAQEAATSWVTEAPEYAYVMVVQRGTGVGAPGYSRAGVSAFIEHLIEEGKVDADRVYVSGLSMGGLEVLHHLYEFPELFAAAIPICPVQGNTVGNMARLPYIMHVPIWYVHSATDSVINPLTAVQPHARLLELGAVDARISNFPAVQIPGSRGGWNPRPEVAPDTWSVFGDHLPNGIFLDGNGEPALFYPNDHWNWIMVFNNIFIDCGGIIPTDPRYGTAQQYGITFMDWMFAQRRGGEPDVLTFDIFNNGEGGSPSRPNAGLAASGTIRMWTQINGVNTPVLFEELTVTAELPNGDCAMRFVTVHRPWVAQHTVNFIDVNKNGPWDRIYLTATVNGSTVTVILVNALYVPTVLSLDIFNNGPNGTPGRQNPGLGPIIRMWTQINGVNTPVLFEDLRVTATLPNGECAMAFVVINRPWVAQHTVNFIDVRRDRPWEVITLTIEVDGRTATVILCNL